jgi:endonuclease G, mitochondrial
MPAYGSCGAERARGSRETMIVTRELIERAEAGLEFDPRPVRRALADRTPTSEADPAAVQRRLVHVLGEGSDASELAIDRIVAGSDALNVSYLERGMIAADAVARIAVHDGARLVGYGTGFMVSPRLLLTNYHVLATADRAVHSLVDFRYEYDALGRLVERATFGLDPAAFFFGDPELDVTVVAVAPETADGSRRATDFGWLRLSPSADTALRGEWLSIVQHCGGRPKQLSLRQNLLITRTGPDLWYVSETATGSSGAPVFNDSWQVVAVHRMESAGASLSMKAGSSGAPMSVRARRRSSPASLVRTGHIRSSRSFCARGQPMLPRRS